MDFIEETKQRSNELKKLSKHQGEKLTGFLNQIPVLKYFGCKDKNKEFIANLCATTRLYIKGGVVN